MLSAIPVVVAFASQICGDRESASVPRLLLACTVKRVETARREGGYATLYFWIACALQGAGLLPRF